VTADGISNANVAALLEDSAARRGSAPAIIGPEGRLLWTFEELAEAAARFGGGLRELGIETGDRVLVLERDARELYRIVTGVLWAGATVVVPPMSLPLRGALEVAATTTPQAVIAGLLPWAAALRHAGLRNAPLRIVSGRRRFPETVGAQAIGFHRPIAPQVVPVDSPAVLSFTTGSTGPVKAVTRTHDVLREQHAALDTLRRLREVDRDFVGLPLLVLHNLGSDVTSILAPRGDGSSRYGPSVREALVRAQATSAAGFPHLFESAVRGASPGELDRLRSIYVGGSRVRPELLRALRAIAPAAAVTVVYGSTEIEPIAAIGADEYLDLLAYSDPADGVPVGMVLDGLELCVEPAAEPLSERPEPSARGERGRILLRGPRASGAAGLGGWVDSGDAGRVDEHGRLWLLGRATNVVGDLYPAEVEGTIEALPWVSRAALVRVDSHPDPRALLAVEPTEWGAAGTRAEQLGVLGDIARQRHWPLDQAILLRRMPVIAGAAAKIDDRRLGKLASARWRRASLSVVEDPPGATG
jgi:acyl-CoA synthetase (AMP-forming)/AMP-acid ligase II